MSLFTIGNASNIPLNVQCGTIPNMGDTLRDWFQPMTFGLITKDNVGYQVDESVSDVEFWGILMPLSGRQLLMKPEGQRQWNWIAVYAQGSPNMTVLDLDVDDLILYQGKQYRVMAKKPFTLYSYIYYELVSDYTGSVPTP